MIIAILLAMSGSGISTVMVVVGCVLLFVVITGFGVRQLLRKGIREAEARLMAKLGQPSVLLRDEMANFFGLTSRGATQLRGNGVLLLTNDVLAFQPLFREDPILIPRKTISATKTVRSHLGKTIAHDLLFVEFADDSVAWYVRSPQPWLAALRPS